MSLMLRRRMIDPSLRITPPAYNSASGDIVTFDAKHADPLQSLVVTFGYTQAGSGDPSISNERPITGVNKVGVFKAPRNLFPKTLPSTAIAGTFSTGSSSISSATNARVFSFYLGKNVDIRYIRTKSVATGILIAFSDVPIVDRTPTIYSAVNMTNRTSYNLNSSTHPYVVVCASSTSVYNSSVDSSEIALLLGTTGTGFSDRIDWLNNAVYTNLGDTYFGGTLDLVTGVLTETWTDQILKGTEPWAAYGSGYRFAVQPSRGYPTKAYGQQNIKSNLLATYGYNSNYYVAVPQGSWVDASALKADLADWYANGAPAHIVYQLATPVTHQLTPQQIDALLGTNNIWSDSGSVSVTYRSN